jgi:hypothetical protein
MDEQAAPGDWRGQAILAARQQVEAELARRGRKDTLRFFSARRFAGELELAPLHPARGGPVSLTSCGWVDNRTSDRIFAAEIGLLADGPELARDLDRWPS